MGNAAPVSSDDGALSLPMENWRYTPSLTSWGRLVVLTIVQDHVIENSMQPNMENLLTHRDWEKMELFSGLDGFKV